MIHMRLFLLLISLIDAQRNATLEFQLANLSTANFDAELKIYIGRNCAREVQTGKTCDYLYQGSVTYNETVGLTVNRGHFYQLPDLVEDNDQIIFTYRDPDAAIFRGIRHEVFINPFPLFSSLILRSKTSLFDCFGRPEFLSKLISLSSLTRHLDSIMEVWIK